MLVRLTYKPQLVYFMGIDNAKFRKPVLPGDQLHYHVKKIRSRGRAWRFDGEAQGQRPGRGRGRGERHDLDPDDVEDSEIHPTAVVEDGARLGDGVRIGPFCHVGPDVALGDGVELVSHVVVAGRTTVGARTRIFPFASIGHQPQDLKYQGEPSTLTIGADCLIREGVTMNPGTEGGGMETIVGDHCTFLANSHVGHDCRIGNNVIFSNNVMLAGHCTVGDFAIIGGGAAVIQFARVGAHSFLGGMSGLENDLIPYGMAIGNRAHLSGLNIVGLQRRGFSRDDIHTLRRAYRLLFADEGTLVERVEDVEEEFRDHPIVQEILAFIRAGGKRVCVVADAAWPGARVAALGSTLQLADEIMDSRHTAASASSPAAAGCRVTIAESVIARGGQRPHRRHRGRGRQIIDRFPAHLGELGPRRAHGDDPARAGGGQVVIAGGVRRPNLWKLRPDLGFFLVLPQILAHDGGRRRLRACRAWCGCSRRKASRCAALTRWLPICWHGRAARGAALDAEARDDASSASPCARRWGRSMPARPSWWRAAGCWPSKAPRAPTRCCAGRRHLRDGRRRASLSGVLTKGPKPGQELRVDMPAIGPRTVEGAAAAGLAGVVVEAGRVLLLDREEAVRAADAAGVAIAGLARRRCAHRCSPRHPALARAHAGLGRLAATASRPGGHREGHSPCSSACRRSGPARAQSCRAPTSWRSRPPRAARRMLERMRALRQWGVGAAIARRRVRAPGGSWPVCARALGRGGRALACIAGVGRRQGSPASR